ncbi:MAG: hypothetical protein IPG92_14290 [Flavobacteriales bacterium]|nr:hypothetical protein [Flavobacteriales bacterium]
MQNLRNMHKSNAQNQFVVGDQQHGEPSRRGTTKPSSASSPMRKDPIHPIRMRDIYSMLELATDKCED